MIRHISMVQMEPKPKNGKTVEENVKDLVAFLEKLPEQEPSIAGCRVASYAGQQPDVPEEASVMFTQVVQRSDFAKPEEAAAYPASKAHQDLMAFSDGIVKKVSAIDFEI